MKRKTVDIRGMSFRVPILRAIATFALAAMTAPILLAQDGASAEVKALRQMIEQQGKQIEQLSAKVTRLAAKVEGNADPAAPAPAAAPPTGNAEFAVPAARVVTPAAPANVHIVVKGESLEKIAKAHGTTSLDLQKLNRISDPKKLQIGQQLTLPPQPPKK
ncbi:MAG: LysM peptidoglycan-binding domain-containing protein [Chthoniobacteraceae bacterium]